MDTMRRTPQMPERRPAQATDSNTDSPEPAKIEATKSISRRSQIGSKSMKKKLLLIVAGIAVIAALLVGGWFAFRAVSPPLVEGGKYQAIFLSNGQVYFGKLKITSSYYVLTDIFYLQASDATTPAPSKDPQATTDDRVKLIKLGTEVHGPTDKMVVAKDQVLFFENLKDDGTVVKSIKGYNDSNN